MILVDDVSNVFIKWMTSSIVLGLLMPTQILAAVPKPPPPPTPASWVLPGPVGSIQGTYKMASAKMDDHPPTLASIWEIGNGDFSVVAWPPKYCAAVHVYFIPSSMKGQGNFHVIGDITESPSLKFYPPIGKVKLSTDGKAKETGFSQRSSVHFKLDSNSKYDVELQEQHQNKIRDYEQKRVKSYKLDLSSRMALVLTNSRFCFAHVLKEGRNGEYTQLFDIETYEKMAELPKVLTRYEDVQGFHSLFVPPTLHSVENQQIKSTKSVDLLGVLVDPTFFKTVSKKQTESCNGFTSASRNKLKQSAGVISVDSWMASHKNADFKGKYEDMFYINIGPKCSWIRLWISPIKKRMDEYATMKLDEIIDIFFDQQFFVGPDSDEARPISGNSTQIDRIAIRKHWIDGSGADKPKVVQMSYGRASGPALTYIEYFHMPSLHQADYSVNLIKAAECEANVVTASQIVRTQSANKARPNRLMFTHCKRFLLQNTNQDEVAP